MGNKQLLHCVLVHVCFCALAAFDKVRCNRALAQVELKELAFQAYWRFCTCSSSCGAVSLPIVRQFQSH